VIFNVQQIKVGVSFLEW